MEWLARPDPEPVGAGSLYVVDQTSVLAVAGDVRLMRSTGGTFELVDGQTTLDVGDRVRTGPRSFASLLFFDGSSTTLGPESELTPQRFERDPLSGASAIILHQPVGTSWTRAEDNGHPHSGFLLTTPAGRFFARGGQFLADVAPDGVTRITAVEGTVFGRAQNTDSEIPEGYFIRTQPGLAPEAPLPARLGPPTLEIRVEGPARALLTDRTGLSTGYHPQSDLLVAQQFFTRVMMEGARQVITVPNPTEHYELTLRGTGEGTVSVLMGMQPAAGKSASPAYLLTGEARPATVQSTSFRIVDEQVTDVEALRPTLGAPLGSRIAVLRARPEAVALAPTPALPVAVNDDPDALVEGPSEPFASDVFAGLDAPGGGLRPLVVAPSLPERPSVVSVPDSAPPRPPVISQAPPRQASAADGSAVRSTDQGAGTPTLLPEPPTPQVRVVTATPLPPSPIPPTRVPPTPLPPTPVPPTPEPTVPPPLPTPVPTAAPNRAGPSRPSPTPQRASVAPTATAVRSVPGQAPTRCPNPVC
jgi:hypothetical protein